MGRLFIFLFAWCLCVQAQLHEEANPLNAPETLQKPYVVLVSLDGFRYDYGRLYGTPHLDAIAKRGITAPQGMYPQFLSTTFPNHQTLVTGLRPAHHGIVDNHFYDPATGKAYDYKKTSGDGSFYSGVPIWSLAEQQGMRAATMFWPGSDAVLAGKRPSYWYSYDGHVSDEQRVAQVIAWLKLPEEQRPHVVTVYFSEVDERGHNQGPRAQETIDAVRHLDKMAGDLDEQLQALHLPIDLVVVADHGMMQTTGNWINLDEVEWLKPFLPLVKHADSFLYADDATAQAIVAAAKQHPDARYRVLRNKDLPGWTHFANVPRFGDLVFLWAPGYYARYTKGKFDTLPGTHGWNPHVVPQMKALFVAEGPGLKQGRRLKSFENLDVYDLLAHLLQLKPAPNDGTLKPFHAVLSR